MILAIYELADDADTTPRYIRPRGARIRAAVEVTLPVRLLFFTSSLSNLAFILPSPIAFHPIDSSGTNHFLTAAEKSIPNAPFVHSPAEYRQRNRPQCLSVVSAIRYPDQELDQMRQRDMF